MTFPSYFRRALAAVAVLALAVGASAGAKTWAVTITKNGYVPNSLSIATGDVVTFTNSDTVAHQVSFKQSTGFTCSPNPLVLQPAASGTCTFTGAGSYSYSDPNVHGNTFRGSITVTAPPETLTLAGKPLLVVFGAKVTLTGTVSTQATGEKVDVFAQQCGSSAATGAGSVQTTTGGAYTASVQPLINTSYTTKGKSGTSNAISVLVRPRLALTRVAPHKYSLHVSAAASFAGKYAGFQRYNGTLRRWVAVKTVALKASTSGVAPTVVSVATFRSTVKAGLRVRMVMAKLQTGTCYSAGVSNTIRS